jgi:bacillithiol biosynthesis cysteine-adding enzyme BshC
VTIGVVSTPISGTGLTRAAIEGSESPWFVSRPGDAEGWRRRGEQVRSRLLTRDWTADLAPAFNASGRAAANLARVQSSGFAVTTGQQPGLFGGPLYTWWKALSAVALAARLESITGVPVVPIFWAATDDSDFAEASYTIVPSAGGAERIDMRIDAAAGTPLARIPVGDLEEQLTRLEQSAGSGASGDILKVVREAYSSPATVGGAYVELLRRLLEPLGVPVLDAAHPVVRATAHPLLVRALERAEDIEDALVARTRDLKAAGHSAQVKLVKGRSLVFGEMSGRRDRIRIRDAKSGLADFAPGSLGPNVLLRPVAEVSIIPSIAYIAGPAEIAYFAQTSAVAGIVGAATPLAVPRWSGFVIEPRIQKILERHRLTIEDFRDPHMVESRIARDSLPAPFRDGMTELRDAINKITGDLARSEGADLVAPSVLEGLKRGMNHRIDRLERRMAASVKRKGNEALHDARIARGFLFPFGTAQERALNLIPLLARNGSELFESVLDEARKHAELLA